MVGKHAFRSTLMIVMSVLGCTAALWAQPQPGDPNINSAADHLNQFAPQAVPQQTIKIGTFDGSNKNFYWDLPVVQIQGWKGPADDGESDPAGGPHQALINSYNVKYEIGLSHKPDNLQVKLFAYDSSAKLVEQQATVNVAGDKATITFNPHSTAAQVIKMTWSGGGQKNVQFYPKLQPQLGAFVVPHLLVAIVYEPPGGKSYASYTRTASVGTVVSWGFARTSGMVETVNPDEMTNMFVEGMSAAVSALGAETAGKVITELNNLKESTTTTTTTSNTSSEDHGNGTFVSLSEEAGTTAHLFPGQGDVFVVLNDVLFMYVVDGGKVKLAPMAYSHPRKLIASELQQQVPSAVAAKYIAFDPMISSNGEVDSKPVKGGLNPKLPGKLNTAQPRFKRFDTWVCEKNAYGEYELRQSEFTSTGTSNTTTETVLTHVTGLAASIDGGGDEFYGVTYSNSKQQTTGDEVVATVHLECGADEQAFEVEVYYDTVFRTFMCKKGQALATQSAMMGTAQDDQGQPLPGKKVSFEVGDHRYSVISDSQGNFKFPFNGMPQGAGTLSLDKASMPITYSGTALKNVKLSVARGSLLASAKGAPKGVGTPGGAAHGGKGNTPVQTSRPSASEGDTASAIRGTPPPPPPTGNPQVTPPAVKVPDPRSICLARSGIPPLTRRTWQFCWPGSIKWISASASYPPESARWRAASPTRRNQPVQAIRQSRRSRVLMARRKCPARFNHRLHLRSCPALISRAAWVASWLCSPRMPMPAARGSALSSPAMIRKK